MFRLTLLLFFTTFFCWSQQYSIIDSLTKEPLSYSLILKDSTGFYTDEFGQFTNETNSNLNIITIKHLGYFDKTVSIKEQKDTIFLTQKAELLPEILVSNKNNIQQVISLKKEKRSMNFFPVSEGNEIILSLKDSMSSDLFSIKNFSFYAAAYIDELKRGSKKLSTAFVKTKFRLNIYNENFIKYYSTDVNFVEITDDKKIEYFFKEEVPVKLKSFYIGIEILEVLYIDPKSDPYISIGLSSQEAESSKVATYIQYNFNQKKQKILLNEIFHNTQVGNKQVLRNLAFDLEIE